MFDRAEYEKYDKKSKLILLSILNSFGYKLLGNIDDEYFKETDIKVLDPQTMKVVKWEIEAKDAQAFRKVRDGQYPTTIINTRKSQNKSDYYCIFSKTYDQLMTMPFKRILESPVKTIHTNRGVEEVFDVSRNHLKLYDIIYKDNNEITAKFIRAL